MNMDKIGLKILVVGCTPLARKTVDLVEEVAELVGVVNLHPELGAAKSNYDVLGDFIKRRPADMHWTRDINGVETISWIADRKPDVIIQCGWSQIFRADILGVQAKKYFAINSC